MTDSCPICHVPSPSHRHACPQRGDGPCSCAWCGRNWSTPQASQVLELSEAVVGDKPNKPREKDDRPVLYVKWDKKEQAHVYGSDAAERGMNIQSKATGGMVSHFFERAVFPGTDGKSLVKELEAAGYDLTTLRFSIRHKNRPGQP